MTTITTNDIMRAVVLHDTFINILSYIFQRNIHSFPNIYTYYIIKIKIAELKLVSILCFYWTSMVHYLCVLIYYALILTYSNLSCYKTLNRPAIELELEIFLTIFTYQLLIFYNSTRQWQTGYSAGLILYIII